MARKGTKASTFTLRVARKSAIVASLCALMLIISIAHPTYAYGDALSDAKAELAAAQKELTAANNAFASLKATKATIDRVNSQAISSTGIINDVIISGQKPLYVPVNGNSAKPANSTLVAVEGMFVNGNSEGWTQQKVIDYINQVRRDAYNEGLVSKYTPVTWSKNLERTAQIRAVEISIYGDHTRPSGEDWFGIGDEGLMPGYAENLSWGGSYYTNIKMWVDEKEDYRKYLNGQPCGVYGHYRNLVNPQLTAIGIAQFNTDRSINPYSTAMAAEFNYSATGSQSSDVKPTGTSVYQGVYVKSSAVGSVGTAGATTFNISAVAGDPIWKRATPVKEVKAFAKSLASAEWSRIQSSYNTKLAAVTAAQKKVAAAQAQVDKLQPNTGSSGTGTATTGGDATSSSSSSGNSTNTNSVNVYRMYNPVTSEHLYTKDASERDALEKKHGWQYEGIAWKAPKSSSQPVYRLYNKGLGDHHYTMDANEVRALTRRAGWQNEGIKWYSDPAKGKPVYRAYNKKLTVGQHHYTPDFNEINALIKNHGWKNEPIAWYGVK